MTLLITEQDIQKILSIKIAIPVIEEMFRMAGEGTAENSPRMRMPFAKGFLQFGAGALHEKKVMGFKVWANFGSPLRQVFNHLLDRTQTLLDHSRALAPMISDYRLRMEVSVIQSVAERLVGKLRRQDPLQTRVKLSAIGYVSALGHGIFNGLFARRSMP